MRKTILSLALVTGLVAAPSALAADRTGTVGASSPSYAWDGGPGTSMGVNLGPAGGASVGNFFGCVDGFADCEETLIKVETAGKLTLLANADDDSKDVLDMYLYPSDAEGTYDDTETDIAEGGGAGTTGDEKIEAQVSPGYYMVQIRFFDASGDTYKGSATLSGFAAPAPAAAIPVTTTTPAPATPAQPAQPAQPAKPAGPSEAEKKAAAKKKLAAKKKACTKKAKKIKNKKKRKKALKRCAKLKK